MKLNAFFYVQRVWNLVCRIDEVDFKPHIRQFSSPVSILIFFVSYFHRGYFYFIGSTLTVTIFEQTEYTNIVQREISDII